MGQSASRHRPDDPVSPQSTRSSTQSSATRVADLSSLSPSQSLPEALLNSSNHNSDLPHQAPLPPKRSRRRSFLGTLRSPLRNCLNSQGIPSDEANTEHASNTHKRWTFDRRRRKSSKPPRTLLDHPEQDEPQLGGPSRPGIISGSSASSSNTTMTDQRGKVKEDTPAMSATDLPTTALVGPSSSGSSTLNLSPSSSVPLPSTATVTPSPSSSASPSTPSSSPPRDPLALNHDPAPLPTVSFEPDDTPGSNSDSSDAFNVMERPATPPDPSQQPPLPEARRNFPAAGTLVVVQGVVHTSDVSQSGASEPSDATSRRASSVPPPGERSSRRRFSELLARPMRSRRSSYAAPESQPSDFNPMLENDSQDESSPTSETSQDSPTQEEPPIPASRPLSLSPTSIDVLGTLLSVATAATAASLVSGSSEPLLNSGLGLPNSASAPGSQESSPPSVSDQVQVQGQTQPQTQSPPQAQSQSQGQPRPLSPTPTAGLASRDRMRNAWAGLRDRLGFRPSSPTTSPAPTSTTSPPLEPEPAPSTSSVNPVDPRTQLLADMARAFQMGMGLEDGSGSGSRSSAPSSPAIEVNLGDGQQRQEEAPPQERSPPPEDSFERFLMDLQVDLRRTLEDGQPEAEPEPEQEQEVEPVGVDSPPLIYPQEASLSTHDRQSTDDDFDFIEALPALPPDDDDLLSYYLQPDDNVPDIGDDRPLEEEAVSDPPPVSSQQSTSQPPSEPQTPTRRTVAGSERRPGGGINWWRMYRFPPMVVPQGTPGPGSSPGSPLPPPATAPPAPAESEAPSAEPELAPPSTDEQANAQDVNTVVPVIVVGLQSVHGYGHNHGHRHTDGRDEHPPHPLPPPQQPQQQPQPQRWQQEASQDNDLPQQDDVPGEATDLPRPRERRWSSRAADALRGLRPVHGAGPTRREGSGSGSTEGATRGSDDGHGSTTFFIYVIGGYYPPNHQLVIGTDPLDSFEELAELLGQAKPQTVSREDIDNSGLEVIRVNSLAAYEKAGRVAPMCVDRCLICLEDYNQEEDLRLLSCRHVFHKDCVDRWLETGRNNCPACRTQGVSPSGPIPIASAA